MRLDRVASEAPENYDADRGEHAGDYERYDSSARPVEVSERARACGERDENQPRKHDNGFGVDPHLEALGLELVEQLEIARGRVDEIVENVPDDRPAALLSEDQDLEHAIARRIGQILLHQLQRRTSSQHARQLREAR